MIPVHKEIKDRRELQVTPDPPDLLDHKVILDHKVFKVIRDKKELPVILVHKDLQEILDLLVAKVRKVRKV